MAFLADLGQEEPGLNRLIRAGYQLLGLQTYFTTRRQGSPRLDHPRGRHRTQAAGVIHTDFERGFIRAQTIALRTSSNTRAKPAPRKPANAPGRRGDYVVRTATY